MSAAITPGPWRTEIDNVFAGSDCNLIYVADCAPMGGPVEGTATAIANARLIAAAPDLYDALETLVKCYGQFGDEPFDLPGDHPVVAGRAALALARTSDAAPVAVKEAGK